MFFFKRSKNLDNKKSIKSEFLTFCLKKRNEALLSKIKNEPVPKDLENIYMRVYLSISKDEEVSVYDANALSLVMEKEEFDKYQCLFINNKVLSL